MRSSNLLLRDLCGKYMGSFVLEAVQPVLHPNHRRTAAAFSRGMYMHVRVIQPRQVSTRGCSRSVVWNINHQQYLYPRLQSGRSPQGASQPWPWCHGKSLRGWRSVPVIDHRQVGYCYHVSDSAPPLTAFGGVGCSLPPGHVDSKALIRCLPFVILVVIRLMFLSASGSLRVADSEVHSQS